MKLSGHIRYGAGGGNLRHMFVYDLAGKKISDGFVGGFLIILPGKELHHIVSVQALRLQYGDSLENSACSCLNKLLEQQCDAVIVCQGMMASETIIYLHQKGIQLARDIDLVSFVDYDSEVYTLYADKMDTIIQPVEELGQAAGEQILRRVEEPAAPVYEKVLTSAYKPYSQPVPGTGAGR